MSGVHPATPPGQAAALTPEAVVTEFRARHREFAAASDANLATEGLDYARAQRAIGVAYRKCAERVSELTPAWDALRTSAEWQESRADLAIAERDQLLDAIAVTERERDGAREQRDDYMNDLAVKIRQRDEAREVANKALAANERWAATLGDVQQRHAEVKRERDRWKAGHDTFARANTELKARIRNLHGIVREALCESDMDPEQITEWLHDRDLPDLDEDGF